MDVRFRPADLLACRRNFTDPDGPASAYAEILDPAYDCNVYESLRMTQLPPPSGPLRYHESGEPKDLIRYSAPSYARVVTLGS